MKANNSHYACKNAELCTLATGIKRLWGLGGKMCFLTDCVLTVHSLLHFQTTQCFSAEKIFPSVLFKWLRLSRSNCCKRAKEHSRLEEFCAAKTKTAYVNAVFDSKEMSMELQQTLLEELGSWQHKDHYLPFTAFWF